MADFVDVKDIPVYERWLREYGSEEIIVVEINRKDDLSKRDKTDTELLTSTSLLPPYVYLDPASRFGSLRFHLPERYKDLFMQWLDEEEARRKGSSSCSIL